MAGTRKGAQGDKTPRVVVTPERRARDAAERKRQEAEWAARNGPVEVRRAD